MKEPTQEQWETMLKWCGLTQKIQNDIEYWYDPQGKPLGYEVCGVSFHTVPLDLNNLFKYAVPKMQNKGYYIELVAFEHKGFRCSIQDMVKTIEYPLHFNDDPALALFWAIWQVVERGNEGE